MSVSIGLKIFGVLFMVRAIVALFHPTTFASLLNYPPTDTHGVGGFLGIGAKKEDVVSPDEVKSALMITQFYGLVQSGLSGLALSTARAADPRTMAVTAVGLGMVTTSFSVYGYIAVTPLAAKLGFATSTIVRLLVPYLILATYLIYAGLQSMKTSKAAKQPLSKSGRAMGLCALFSIAQGLPLVLLTEVWFSKFRGDESPEMHETTTAVIMALAPLWGICVAGGAMVRLAIISVGHSASIYAANRATAIYYAMLVGTIAMAKTYSSNAPGPMTVQLYAAFTYFALSYFGGVVADDMAKAKGK